jgi:coenzyme F420-0:L-glutamate ligase/coenzyme F420-1:gamma-L-glutamate ligase
MGTAEARVAGLRDAAALGDAASFVDSPVDTERVRRAIAGLGRVSATFTVVPARSRGEPAHAAHVVECEPTGSLVDFGADLHRLRCALAADDLAAITLPPDPDDPPDHLSLAVGVQQP